MSPSSCSLPHCALSGHRHPWLSLPWDPDPPSLGGDLMLSVDESLPVLRRTRPESLGRAGRTVEASGPAQVSPPAAATCSLALSLHAPGGPRQAVPALCAPRRTRAALHRGDGIRQRPWSRALGPRLGSLQPRLNGLSPRGNRFIRLFVACAGAVSRWWRPDRRTQRSAVWCRGTQAARPQRRVGLRQPELRVRPGAT